ncbi:MAG: L,D-transpeptidase family protein [Coriobacteriia bacterium]|nr:L,D-transpeptidase family protein [Coriobacteriia bacterium]
MSRHRLTVVVLALAVCAVAGGVALWLGTMRTPDEPVPPRLADITDVDQQEDQTASETSTSSTDTADAVVASETPEPDVSDSEPPVPPPVTIVQPPKSFHGSAFGDATQVIVVTADSMSTTRATLRTYQKSGGTWGAVMSTSACVGKRGLVLDAERVEGQLQTPIGTYSLPYAFGIAANPNTSGSSLAYERVGTNTYYDGNYGSATFNDQVEGVPSAGDNYEYMYLPTAYKYGIDTNFNPEQKPGKGNAIFIHCNTGSGYTAGCVSIGESKMVELLRWLDRTQDPVVLICLTSEFADFYH